MIEQMTLIEFLNFLKKANGDEAIEKIDQFQRGGLSVSGVTVDELG